MDEIGGIPPFQETPISSHLELSRAKMPANRTRAPALHGHKTRRTADRPDGNSTPGPPGRVPPVIMNVRLGFSINHPWMDPFDQWKPLYMSTYVEALETLAD